MKEVKDLIAEIDQEQLVKGLIGSGYAFACWKNPNERTQRLIISLKTVEKIKNPISELDSGFLMNRFEDSHPIEPYHIKADVIIEDGNSLTIDPRINADELERFHSFIAESSKHDTHETSLDPAESYSFESAVDVAVKEIKGGSLEKVVLSRFVDHELDSAFSLIEFFKELCQANERAFCSLVYMPGEGVWVGATPELLLANNHERFLTVALAGTKEMEEDQDLAEIFWTQKEIEEQALVSRYIINSFKKIRLREFHEHGPKTVRAGRLAHLKTTYEVKYDEVSFEGLMDQMVSLLHPTSAVCGMPLDQASAFIKSTEKHSRSFYSGFLGPVNFNSNTDLYVNLRCMNIVGNKVRFYAGAGITEDSKSEKELIETQLKMQTLLALMS